MVSATKPNPLIIDDSAARGPVSATLVGSTATEILGSAFNDLLTGGPQGGGLLVGGGGNDTLVSQGSNDTLSVTSGGDVFTFTNPTATGDLITHFQSDTDGIDLRPVLAAMNYHGSDPLTDGTISFASVSGGTAIMLSSDGNAADAHLLATVEGVSTLHPWDFYLPPPPPPPIQIDDSAATGPVTVDLSQAAPTIKTVLGSAFNDSLTGSVQGGDLLVGNGGNDTLVSQGSQDTMTGGAGGDIFTFASATATGSVITDFQSDTDGIDLRPVLGAMSYHGSDPLNDGTISFASVSGGTAIMLSTDSNAADAHLLATVEGVSTLHPWDFYLPNPPPPTTIDDSNASGPVTVDLGASGIVAQTAIGSAFNDVLTSNPNDGDLLIGGGGNDTLVSTGSGDTLTGGAGGDIFTFTSATATGSVITDFQSDTDGIDLRPVLATMNYHGSDPLNDGTISFASVSGGTAIMLSTDGNAADAHLLATVEGVSTLHPWDFYLPTAAVSPPPPPASPPAPPVDPHTLWVGADQQYHTIADAVAASQGGDTIMVEAGTYENQTAIITHDLTIEGVGGFASFAWDDGLIPNGKAIFVVDANVTFENVELSGAAVDDGNGAGIRDEVGNLTVINSYIHDNQDGILSGTIPGGQVVLENSSFARNGIGDDQTHNVYIGHEASLVATGNYFFDAQGGADLKSRALTNTITANSFVDTHEYSTTGYAIDLSDGNDATVTDNFFHRDGRASNSNIIHYGGEVPDPTGSLLVENNYFESTRDTTTAVFNQTNLTSVDIADNQFNDVTQILSGPGTVEANNTSNFNVAIASTDNAIAPVAGFGGLGYQLLGQASGSVGITVPPPPPPPVVDINDSAATGPVTVDLGATGQHSVLGSTYSDLLTGNPSGSSQLFGNDGNDTLVSQGSNDTMTGGAGGDVFTFNNPTATNSVVTDFQSDTDNIDLRPLLAAMNYNGTNPYTDGHVTTAAVTGGTAIMVSPTGQAAAAHELVVVQGVSALQPWDFLH